LQKETDMLFTNPRAQVSEEENTRLARAIGERMK